jgi:hypothetical protein
MNQSLSGETTPVSQDLAPLPQRCHEQTAYHHAAREQTHTSVDTDAFEHGPAEQDRSHGEQAPREAVCGEDRCGITRVDVGDVQQHALGDKVRAEDGHGEADGWRYPVYVCTCSPCCRTVSRRYVALSGVLLTIEEEPDGNEGTRDHAGDKEVFEFAKGSVTQARKDAVLEVYDMDRECERACGGDTEETRLVLWAVKL